MKHYLIFYLGVNLGVSLLWLFKRHSMYFHALLISALDGVKGQLYPPAASLQRKSARYPLCRRLCGPQNRSGYSGGEEENGYPCRQSHSGRHACTLV
jgi:hypothetical protein